MDKDSVPPTTVKVSFGSAFDLFKPSFNAVKLNIGVLITFFLVIFIPATLLSVAAIGTSYLTHMSTINSNFKFSPLIGIGYLILLVISVIAAPAITYTALRSAQQHKVDFNEAFNVGLKFALRYLGLTLLLALIFIVSFILFIVPFFFVLPRYYLAPYYLVDQNLGIWESLKHSSKNYKRYKGTWGLIGVSILLDLPSSVPIIGSLISVVLEFIYSCAPALRYYQIKEASGVHNSHSSHITPATNPQPPTHP